MTRSLLADLRYAFRMLRQAPLFGSIAIAALTLGIGANTAIFSMVNALLLRALPYADADRVVMVWEDATFAGFPKNTPSPGNFFDWKERNTVFSDMAATRGIFANLTGDGAPEQLLGRLTTANFFDVLGVKPLLGRTFTADEDRDNARVVLLTYAVWQRRFGGDPAIVNRDIVMNSTAYQVIGVLPRGFLFRNREIGYFAPIHFSPSDMRNHGSHYLQVVARLKPGATVARAREEMDAIAKRLQTDYPQTNKQVGAVVSPIREDLLGNTRDAMIVLMAAAGCVLLIACANLANLLLARAMARQREMAVRAALGAGRGRLVRQLVTEGLLLSVLGGVAGLALARVSLVFLTKLAPSGFDAASVVGIDLPVLAFTLAISLATGVLFSVVPALQISRVSLNDTLRQGGRAGVSRGRAAARDALVVAEVAVALVLLIGAGLMLRTLARLRSIDIGFRPDHLLTLRTNLPRPKYEDPARRLQFFDRVIAGVKALPGVENAAYNSTLPFVEIGNTQGFTVEGRPRPEGEPGDALFRVGTNDYLKTLGVHMVEGRVPDARDGASTPRVIVINETLKRRYFPHESALGHHVSMGEDPPVWRTIVGVVQDVRERGYGLDMKPGVYIPFAQIVQTWAQPAALIVRANGDPAALTGAVRRVIATVDPDQPVAAVRTMDEILDLNVEDRTQQMTLLSAFASLALLLASVGLYGVLSYTVSQRIREIGLRMALGATTRQVLGMVVGRGLALTGAGLAIGLALAVAASRAMKSLLYGVDAIDPVTFLGVSVLLCGIAALACWAPARRAARVDPIIALREE